MTEILKIYCDGACSNNPGIGGWGAVLLWEDNIKKISGREASSTNNRMELVAIIQALKVIKKDVTIEVYTDSKYLLYGITKWIHNWKKTEWNKGEIKNIDLWQELDALVISINSVNIKWYWVKGHSGDRYNEMADKLAKDAILNIE